MRFHTEAWERERKIGGSASLDATLVSLPVRWLATSYRGLSEFGSTLRALTL